MQFRSSDPSRSRDHDLENGFITLMDALTACTAITDDSGKILAVNQAWESAPGPNPFVSNLEPGADFRHVCETLARSEDGNLSIVALGLLELLKGQILHLNFEYPVHSSGKIRWYGLGANRSDRGAGSVIQILDVTEKMEARQRLHRIEQLFKVSTENALNLFCILDPDCRIRYCSPSYQRNFGIGHADWSEQSYPSRIREEDRGTFLKHMKSCLVAGLSPLFEYRLLARDGSWKYLEGRASLVDGISGDSTGLLLVCQDITTRKEAEQDRASMEVQLRHGQKMEAIGQLAAGIAHEINTPTQYIGDNLHFLEEAFKDLCDVITKETGFLKEPSDRPLPSGEIQKLLDWLETKDLEYLMSEVPKALRQSAEGLNRVSTIVQAMKIFSHPGNEGRTFLDLNQAIETTLMVAKNEWKFVAEVETDFAPDLPQVECFPSEINQVFLNLVVNAAHSIADKVGNSGQLGCIRIQTRKSEDHVEIRVLDSGTGIPENIRDQIFLPFFTTKAVGRGSGQGLSIVHSVITKHGGKVSFESEMGKGTCFIVTVPIHRPQEPKA